MREKAVKALVREPAGEALPYLLIRLNDWVPVIRSLAKIGVRASMQPEHAEVIVRCLPLLLELSNYTRHDHSDILQEVSALFSDPTTHPALRRGLVADDEKIRRYCYRLIVEERIFANQTVLTQLLQEPSPFNRLFVLEKMLSN